MEPEIQKYIVADSTLREQVNNLAEPLKNCSTTFQLLMTRLQAHTKPDGQEGRRRFATTAGLKWYLGKKDIMELVDRLAHNRATVDVWLSAITFTANLRRDAQNSASAFNPGLFDATHHLRRRGSADTDAGSALRWVVSKPSPADLSTPSSLILSPDLDSPFIHTGDLETPDGSQSGRISPGRAADNGRVSPQTLDPMKSSRRAEAQASAFHAATKDGNLALVEFLLEDGIDVDVKNADGRTALSIAAEQGSDPIVRKLLEYGADPALKSAKISNFWTNKFCGERTPLHWAAYNGHVGCTKLLLDHGADPDSRNYSCRTPIQEATMRGRKSVVQVLLDHGADVSPRDNVGWTPLHETAFHQILHIAELLLDRGADIGAITTEDVESVLHLAAREGKRESVAFFLRKGANPKLETRFGKTAAQLALESGNKEIAQLIGGYGTSG